MRLTHAAIALTAFCTWFGEVAGQTSFPTPAICNAEPTRPVIHRTTEAPTGFPTDSPTKSPTMFPIKSPTMSPSKAPTMSPIKSPTMSPSKSPTMSPSKSPTMSPSKSPTMSPSKSPTMSPIKSPTMSPSKSPTMSPSKSPTMTPIKSPTMSPSKSPTMSPTMNPTKLPTMFPSKSPTMSPTKIPTKSPTRRPTMSPTKRPTLAPTKRPTLAPVNIIPLMQTRSPSNFPTKRPSKSPTMPPSKAPTKRPSKSPTKRPTKSPSTSPTKSPSKRPSKRPSKSPTKSPTMSPTKRPTTRPTSAPTCTYKPLAICIALDQSGSICTPPGVPAHTCTSCPLCQNYRDQLNFASNFTKLLAAAEQANVQHRYSAVEFSTISTVVLNLTTNEAAARSTIDNLTYQGGMTNTGDALRDCYKLLINQDATPFIILVTDGVPTAGGPGPLGRQYASHKNYSSAMAKMVKDSGIGLVPVYVNTGNSETDSGYLKTLSSDGDYLDVKSFDDLKNSVTSLAAMVNCRNTSWVPKSLSPTKRPTKRPTKSPSKSPTMFPTRSPTMRPTKRPTKRPTNSPVKSPTSRPSISPTKRPTKKPSKSPTKSPTKRPTSAPTCASKPLAICIALDQSGSICSPPSNINECIGCPKCTNFQDELDFASQFIALLVSSENGMIQHKFSAVKFSTESVVNVTLTTNETIATTAIKSMGYQGGMTNTGDAIYDCYDVLKRQDASPHIVLITDGTPTIGGNSTTSHKAHATAAADLVRNSGMGLIPVIVNTGTSHVDATFLQSLGTDRNKFINVSSFAQLNSTVMNLVNMVKCGNTTWIPASPPQPQPTPKYSCPVGTAVVNTSILDTFVGQGRCPKPNSVLCGFNGNQNELVFTNQLKNAVQSGRLNCTTKDSSKTVINFKVSNATYKTGSSEIIGFTLQIDQPISVDGYKMDDMFVKASTGGKGYSPAANNAGFSNGYFLGESNYEISHVAVCVSRCPVVLSPTKRPTKSPTKSPTKNPTKRPTKSPTKNPVQSTPTKRPTKSPTKRPTKSPTKSPTKQSNLCPTNPNWAPFDNLTTFEATSNGWEDPRSSTNSLFVTNPSCPSGNSCWRLSGGNTPETWDRRVYKYLNNLNGNLNYLITFNYNVTGANGILAVEEYCVSGASQDWTTLQTFQINSTDLVPNVLGCKQVNFTYPAGCTKGKILCTWTATSSNDQIFLDDIQIFRR